MRALVTGGAGFIGSTLARALHERGDDVVVFDNLYSGMLERVPEGAELIVGDIRDEAAIRAACTDVDVVFHQAAVPGVRQSVENPFLTTECNINGTLNVLVAAQQAGVRRLVFASSSSIYGESEAGIQREEASPNPISPYAVSKLAGEQYCRVWTRVHNFSTVSLRYFNVFGPGQSAKSQYAAVFPAFVSAAVRGEAAEVHWDGEQSRDFTFVDEVVRANLLASAADKSVDGQVINIAGGEPKTVNQVLKAVSEAVGVWIEPTRVQRRAGDIRHSHADVSRARQLLGWTPSTRWDDAVTLTVDWFKGV